MTCASCVSTIERHLKRHPGIREAHIGLLSESAEVEFDSGAYTRDDIAALIRDIGYDAKPVERTLSSRVVQFCVAEARGATEASRAALERVISAHASVESVVVDVATCTVRVTMREAAVDSDTEVVGVRTFVVRCVFWLCRERANSSWRRICWSGPATRCRPCGR